METNSRSEIEERIKYILISQLGVKPSILAKSSSTTPLFGRGIGIDSIETLALVAGIEGEFDIQVDDEDLTVDLFKNIETLAEYVLRKSAGMKSR